MLELCMCYSITANLLLRLERSRSMSRTLPLSFNAQIDEALPSSAVGRGARGRTYKRLIVLAMGSMNLEKLSKVHLRMCCRCAYGGPHRM